MPVFASRAARRGFATTALALLVGLAGCAIPMEVRTLATARPDLVAYELTGADLNVLRRQAQQMCPQGAEILREGGHEQRAEPADDRTQRWLNVSSTWFEPPRRAAQLMVLCGNVPSQLPPAEVPITATTVSRAPAVVAPTARTAVPVGPLSIEW